MGEQIANLRLRGGPRAAAVLIVVILAGPQPPSATADLDVIICSARKWARLALAGNPTVLPVLFVPDCDVVFRDQAGAELTANAHRCVSRLAAGRYLGSLRAHRHAPGLAGPGLSAGALVVSSAGA